MADKTLATLGIPLLASAILVSWGTSHWFQTRTFDPVDMPVSLDHGPIRTGEFDINLRETYWMSIQTDHSADDNYGDGRCPSKNLGDHWRVFRINRGSPTERELWDSRDDSNDVYWLNAFLGVPGRYEVEWDVPVGPGCLNARHPRFGVYTSSRAYFEFGSLIEYPCLLLSGTRVMLLLRSFTLWLVPIFRTKPELRIFPNLILTNLLPTHPPSPTPPLNAFSNFRALSANILSL